MARGRRMVPFGTEIEEFADKGTLIVMDAFESFTVPDIMQIAEFAEKRNFATVVLYPHNAKTLKTMGIKVEEPFSKRLDQIRDIVDEADTTVFFQIEPLEGKRDKYTPIDFALRFMMEKYEAPYFLYMNDTYANQFAAFPVFAEWIRKIRLVIDPIYRVDPHPKLMEHQSRWEYKS